MKWGGDVTHCVVSSVGPSKFRRSVVSFVTIAEAQAGGTQHRSKKYCNRHPCVSIGVVGKSCGNETCKKLRFQVHKVIAFLVE